MKKNIKTPGWVAEIKTQRATRRPRTSTTRPRRLPSGALACAANPRRASRAASLTRSQSIRGRRRSGTRRSLAWSSRRATTSTTREHVRRRQGELDSPDRHVGALCVRGCRLGRVLSGGGRRRAALAEPLPATPLWRSSSPARSCCRALGGVTPSRPSSAVAARDLGIMRRSRRRALSARGCRHGRVLSGGGRCRAALAAPLPAAPRWRSASLSRPCRHARGGVTLDRYSFAATACNLGVAWRGRRRALCVRGCRHGCVLSGGGRRGAALAAPLPAAPHWRSA